MYKWLIIIACFVVFAGCKKSEDVQAQRTQQAAIDDKAIEDYIKTNNIPAIKVGAGRAVDTTGVWYVVENAGTTPAVYTSATTITVGFTAKTLLDQNTFTSTSDIHPSFVLGSVIKAWQFGIAAAKPGINGKVRIITASRYAYGPYPQPQYGKNSKGDYNLPANALLDFEIEIFDVKN
ncbi:FKBP-type peptidyl-prolyl cis-trans isomerase [Mucilaginibacter sp. KACC 22063]|uniref:FKBP-type peptidyl-prolyl cis-trans isomerase n=1 Tax=Mucilaginibacter sp. KACC 22063 TaxID=3025666 RepID=UPI002366FF58|nr:FKBP-type peptidyl-prolyl cis-trans isomerase [Mucilaginibacter sp. KACC 22063]WDF54636.1 FKBP-type peptidyl-prolyl cis-trans isomerase [Mucilaginibacter sp. KACC 22063]